MTKACFYPTNFIAKKMPKKFINNMSEVNIYNIGDFDISLSTDAAAEKPLYIYLSKNKNYLLFSNTLTDLLNDSRTEKPLAVSSEGLSFLFQSGVIPPPKTIYENIYILGIGDTVNITTLNQSVYLEFIKKFPFLRSSQVKNGLFPPEEKAFLNILGEAIISRLDPARPSFLFHSAGKDSNSIALALAEAGWQDRITLVSQQSTGAKDESILSERIANFLGFKHLVLKQINSSDLFSLNSIYDYFREIPLPTTDQATLAYPYYTTLLDFNHSNIIDGSGNDVFIGHIPSRDEFFKQKKFSKLHLFRSVADTLNSERRVRSLCRTRAEWTGLGGVSFGDFRKLYCPAYNVYPFWSEVSRRFRNEDYIDFRARIRGTVIDTEKIIRKVRNFSDYTSSNLVLPWTDEKVVKYILSIPEQFLFNRKELTNKLFIRKILKKKIGIDSNLLGKMSFRFDYYKILEGHIKDLKDEVFSCRYWQPDFAEIFLNRLIENSSKNRFSQKSQDLIHKIYVVSLWLNRNKYVN